MRHILKKSAAVLMAAAVAVGSLSGCGARMDSSVMATYGDEKIGREEALLMAKYSQYSYEYGMQDYYTDATDFWQGQMQPGVSNQEMVKQSVMAAILQTRILCDKAKADNVTLTEEEQKKVDDAVTDMQTLETVVKASGATEEMIRQMMTNNALANKVYESMVTDIDTNVDEAEFLRKDMDVVSVAEKEEESTDTETSPASTDASTDASQGTQEGTTQADEKKIGIEELADQIKREMIGGKTLDDVQKDYKDAEFTVTTQVKVAVGKTSNYPYAEQAMKLAKDEYTTVSTEDQGTYVVRCTSEKDEEATQEAVKQELENRKSTMFQEKYKELADKAPKFEVNEKEWEKIVFNEPVYEKETASGEEGTGDVTAAPTEGQAAEESQGASNETEQPQAAPGTEETGAETAAPGGETTAAETEQPASETVPSETAAPAAQE